MSRTVVVTGAGGFVGSHMAEGFLAMGDTVIAIDSLFDAATRARLVKAELIEASLTADLLAKNRTVDLVIHAAAITTPPQDYGLSDADHIAANVGLLDTSIGLAMAHRATDLVFLSSSGVFSSEDGEDCHFESTSPTATIPYALAKRAGEAAASAANGAALRALSIRLGPIFGPHEVTRHSRQIVSQVRRWLDRIDAGQPIVVHMPDERRDWTFAPDLPRALDALLGMQPPVSGVVHLTSAHIVSNRDLASAVAALVAGSEVRIEPSDDVARLPMASDRVDMASLYAWTPLSDGLWKTRSAEVAH